MCVAIVKPRGATLPTDKEFMAMFSANPHGAGVAWASEDGTKVEWVKGIFSAQEWISVAREHCTKDKWALLHARIATAGSVCAGNTHPFPLTTSIDRLNQVRGVTTRGVLIHNGILDIKPEHADISDSMQFVINITENEAYAKIRNNKELRKTIAKRTAGSKIAVMFPDGKTFMFGGWEQDPHTKCYYSNNRWKFYLSDVVMGGHVRYMPARYNNAAFGKAYDEADFSDFEECARFGGQNER